MRRLAVNVEVTPAFVGVATGKRARRFDGRAARVSAFGERVAAFRFGSDALAGRDRLRVAKRFERDVGARRDFRFAAKFDGKALRRKIGRAHV